MAAIIEQFGLDQTYFILIGVFIVVYLILTRTFFRPFQELIEYRYRKTVEDRQTAERLAAEAEAKLKEYQERLHEARLEARKAMDDLLAEARAKETEMYNHAREEAKRITQEALAQVQRDKQALQAQLQGEVEAFAWQVSEKFLGRKG